jgi:hypothetical protein
MVNFNGKLHIREDQQEEEEEEEEEEDGDDDDLRSRTKHQHLQTM